MNSIFGQTRTYVGPRHALITPDGHVPSTVSGVENGRTVAHITPAIGAHFSLSTIALDAGGSVRWAAIDIERFLYISAGEADLVVSGTKHLLKPGSYAYLPPTTEASFRVQDKGVTIVLFEKKFEPLENHATPELLLGHADDVEGSPFLGNPRALLQALLPDHLAFDLAVNIFTYEPGATLPFVETHIMEHGLLMLRGQGIYRLEDRWYPVAAGDIIWMAPFCPQWFVAMGDEPASYLYYKDVNRAFIE